MKNLKFFALATVITTISFSLDAQIWGTVRGNHEVVTEERKTDDFTGIKVSSGIDVYLKQGNDVSVTVEADENLQEHIYTEVRNGILHIYTKVSIRDAERKRAYVTMDEIRSVETTSAGDITGESTIKTGNLRLSASSAGNIDLEVEADDIEVDISSSGDITLSGDAGSLEADLSSAGNLKAFDLNVREADISVSSAGDADVNVSEKLVASASSAGDINYMGNPKYIDSRTSSAGGIHRRK